MYFLKCWSSSSAWPQAFLPTSWDIWVDKRIRSFAVCSLYHHALPDFGLRLRWRYPAQYRGNSFRFKGSNRLLWPGFFSAALVPRLLGGTAKQQGVWRYSLVFSNMAFIGYPVSVALFGQEALFYAVILVLPFNLLSYSIGPLMLAGQAKFRWQQLLSPCIVTSVIALMVALFHINMPTLLGECLNFTGSLTTPLSLLLVGSLLSDLPFGRAFTSPRLWALAAFRLLILPIMLWLFLKWTGIGTPLVANIAVILMAMPTALNGSMLAMEYGGDTECMAQSIFLATLMSIITIPVLAALL